jgi:hypothetical protein
MTVDSTMHAYCKKVSAMTEGIRLEKFQCQVGGFEILHSEELMANEGKFLKSDMHCIQ